MSEEDELEFQMELIEKTLDMVKLDHVMFSHKAIQCIHELLDQIPVGVQKYLISDITENSKIVISIVKEIMVQYFELENVKDKIKENSNG